MLSALSTQLRDQGSLVTPSLIQVFEEIPRAAFLPTDLVHLAQADIALPIGFGQTISQPTTVAIMLELLEVQEGETVLDVGSGSGWSTALLALSVGEQGKVVALERIPELYRRTRENVSQFGLIQAGIVECVCTNAAAGYPPHAPYNKILVSARASRVPVALKRELALGGKLIIPLGTSLHVLERLSEDDYQESEYPGFIFVPFIEEEQ